MNSLQNYLDVLLCYIPLTFSIIGFLLSIFTILTTHNLFGSTYLPLLGNTHSLTVLSISLFYPIVFLFTNKIGLPVPIRVMTVVVFMSIGLYFNGVIWSFLNLFIGSKTGNPLLNLDYLMVVFLILFFINRKYDVVDFHKKTLLILLPFYFLSIVLLVNSNFFYQWSLTEQFPGLYPDPHNLAWGLEQFFGLWFVLGFIRK